MANLPDEIIFDILSRLPVISLCRFRSVSKPWQSLISNPGFIRAHLNRNPNNNNHVLVILCYDNSLYSLDSESFQFGDELVPAHLKFPNEQNMCFLQICGSCDGLLLILIDDDECYNYCLVNPSTREYRILPESPFDKYKPRNCFDVYGFGYVSGSDDYKVVRICQYGTYAEDVTSVYSRRSNSWETVYKSPYASKIGPESGVLVSGALHWLTRYSFGTSIEIAAFDLADDKFRTIPSLHCMGNELAVLGGCLCVSGEWFYNCSRADFWVMKEYGVGDSWTKFTVTYESFRDSWKPLTLSRSCQVLFQANNQKLVLWDLLKGNSKEREVQGLPNYFQGLTYVESLFHPIGNAKNHN